jgi:hypothetical protein
MRNYLAIKMYDDSGEFNRTDNEDDLQLGCSINFLMGDFNEVSLNLNVSSTYTPTSGDKFYFLPGVTVPRVKMKDLHKDYNVKSVRDIEDANIIFMGAKTIGSLTDYHWEYEVNTDQFRNYIQAAREKGLMSDYYHEKLATALEFYTEETLIVDNSAMRLLYDDDISFCIRAEHRNSSARFIRIRDEYVDLYNKIKDKQLYQEDAIYDYINGNDAVSIDQSMYEILKDMFRSSDTDNHVLAMEIMANCDYKSSILYLCYLFNTFRYQIENRRERTHVNFKSLITYMGLTTGNVNMDKDDMVSLMMKKKLFTKDYFFKLCEKFSDELENYSSDYFKVKVVSSSDEVNQYFNEELTYQIKENYKPIEETLTTQHEFTNPELDII